LNRVAAAWLLTVGLEAPTVAVCYPRGQRLRMAVACVIATTATNLAMNTFLARTASSYVQYLLIGESCALLLEAAVYLAVSKPRDIPRAVAASAAANALSFGAAWLLW